MEDQQQQHAESMWLYEQRLDGLVSQFDARYDRIQRDTSNSAAAADKPEYARVASKHGRVGAGEKTELPRSRLLRLRACIR